MAAIDSSDSEDEVARNRAFREATKRFDKAVAAHEAKKGGPDAVKLFLAVEEPFRRRLKNGLAGLSRDELAVVLKSRLHRAALLAASDGSKGSSENWPEVRTLTEEVLIYDCGNSHAFWLRGLALAKLGQRLKAVDSIKKAIESATSQGQTREVEQWEQELKWLEDPNYAENASADAGLDPLVGDIPDDDRPYDGPQIEELSDDEPSESRQPATSSSSISLGATSSATADQTKGQLKRGFFNKPEKAAPAQTKKASDVRVPSQVHAVPNAEATAASKAKGTGDEAAPSKTRETQVLTHDPVGLDPMLLQDLAKRLSSEMVGASTTEAERHQDGITELIKDLKLSILALGDDPDELSEEDRNSLKDEADKITEACAKLSTLDQKSGGDESLAQGAARRVGEELVRLQRTLDTVPKPQPVADRPDPNQEIVDAFLKLPVPVKLRLIMEERSGVLLLIGAGVLGMLLMFGILIEVYSAWRCSFRCGSPSEPELPRPEL